VNEFLLFLRYLATRAIGRLTAPFFGNDEQAGLFNIPYHFTSVEWRVLIMGVIKCNKGVRWMPWHQEAMKDVVRCDKSWGAANKL
jgi:hypothetical protein